MFTVLLLANIATAFKPSNSSKNDDDDNNNDDNDDGTWVSDIDISHRVLLQYCY